MLIQAIDRGINPSGSGLHKYHELDAIQPFPAGWGTNADL